MMNNINFFEIGDFWKFTIAGFLAILAACSVIGMAYPAVAGYAAEPGLHIETIEASNLLSQMNFLLAYIIVSLILTWFVILTHGLHLIKMSIWINRGIRYFDCIGCTFFSFVAIYNLALIMPVANSGAGILWKDDLMIISPVIFAGVVFFYICSLWLISIGYFLQEETDWVKNKSVSIIRRFWKRLINNGGTV